MKLQSVKQRFGIIGMSKKLDNALDTAVRVANTELSVLITGESGVGKEVFSRIIHNLSARKHNNFIAVNTGAIPSGTINSELFGHEKGAFTGATAERKGYFETVNGGTIFLDEIGEMPLDTQAFLLRVLETGEFIRVGSSKPQTTDVRVIAATNVDLQDKIKQGKFREDLYYRLNTVPIQVPALRERQQDIYMLFRKFANDFADKYRTPSIQLNEKARLVLESYLWPGNIRELKNVAEQISVMSEERMVDAETLVHFIPNLLNRNLPAIHHQADTNSFEEREILYKLLFDMKNDLNDLKSLIFELIKDNNLSVNDIRGVKSLLAAPSSPNNIYQNTHQSDIQLNDLVHQNDSYSNMNNDNSFIINNNDFNDTHFTESIDIEENLSLADMEKKHIKRALEKYHGRRKNAAEELGISERTLYRKIKEYDLDV